MVPDLQTAEGIYQNLFRGRFTNFPQRIMECSVEIEIMGFTAASRYVIFFQNSQIIKAHYFKGQDCTI